MENAMFLFNNVKEHEDCYFSFCGYSKTESSHSYGPAVRKQFLIHIILNGKGYYSINDQKYFLSAGQGFVIPPNVPTFYQADEDDPWEYVWIGLDGKLVSHYLSQMGITNQRLSFDVRHPRDFQELIFPCFGHDNRTVLDDLFLQKQCYAFLECLLKSIKHHKQNLITQKMNPYVSKTLEIINQEANQNLSVAQISERLSLNQSYLSRLFKKEIGTSIKKYMNDIRILRSCDLLALTDSPIQAIANEVGFVTLQAFSKAFKEVLGMTPSAYRMHHTALYRKNDKSRRDTY